MSVAGKSVTDVLDRRELERDWLRTVIERSECQSIAALEGFALSMIQTPEFRLVYEEILRSVVGHQAYDPSTSKSLDAVTEILLSGVSLNGSWSAAGERLLNPRFDRTKESCSDLGNGRRFVAQFGARVRYDNTAERWVLWDGKVWHFDESGVVNEMMKESARGIYVEANAASDEGERKRLGKWAIASESVHYQRNGLISARSDPSVSLTGKEFDQDSWLLNCQNGMIDLRTPAFLPHDHRRLCSKISGAEFREGAQCPHWQEFLSELFAGDVELIGFIQRSVGYSLTGTVDAQSLFFAYGTGANGKSTFFEILRMLFGDYYQTAPSSMLMLQKFEAVPIDIARLRGARLAVCSEIEQGRHLAESKTKMLTGGDTIVARHLYGHLFEFSPTHKLWIFGNHRPVVRGTDYAIWRRILLVPFNVTIDGSKRRPQAEILREMKRELSGILAWALEGLAAYKQQGLNPPGCVRVATERYREDSDTVGKFIDECCVAGGRVSTKDLYDAFVEWGGPKNWQRGFTDAVREHGFTYEAGHANRKIWTNLGIRDG